MVEKGGRREARNQWVCVGGGTQAGCMQLPDPTPSCGKRTPTLVLPPCSTSKTNHYSQHQNENPPGVPHLHAALASLGREGGLGASHLDVKLAVQLLLVGRGPAGREPGRKRCDSQPTAHSARSGPLRALEPRGRTAGRSPAQRTRAPVPPLLRLRAGRDAARARVLGSPTGLTRVPACGPFTVAITGRAWHAVRPGHWTHGCWATRHYTVWLPVRTPQRFACQPQRNKPRTHPVALRCASGPTSTSTIPVTH